MRSLFVLTAFLLSLCMIGCDDNSTNSSATGMLRVEGFDSPPPVDVDSIWLHVLRVEAHSSADGWVTLSEPDTVFDFLELTNGVTAVLADTTVVPAGDYQQMRLVLSDSNNIFIDGAWHPLIVPSGTQSGVKINLNFTVEPDELVEIMIDFDAGHSINWTPNDYKLKPVFHAFKKTLSEAISGTVTDTLGVGIEDAMVTAFDGSDSTSTLTDTAGNYTLILPSGTYTLEASAAGYTMSDTTYTSVVVDPDDLILLTDFDFVLQ